MMHRIRRNLTPSRIVAAFCLVIGLAAGGLGAFPAAAMTGVPYGGIVATHSGKCITVRGASLAQGALVEQDSCAQGLLQQWQVLPVTSPGFFQISARGSGLCVAIPQSLALQMVQMPCDGDPYQAWSIVAINASGAVAQSPADTAGYVMQSQKTKECLDIYGVGQDDARPLVHWACNGGQNQLFQFEQALFTGLAPATIVSQATGQCAGAQDGSTQVAALAAQSPCGTLPNATWALTPVSAGIVMVRNTGDGQCLDVYGAQTQPGAAVIQYTCKGSVNQQWKLHATGNAWQLVAQNSGLCLVVSGAAQAAGTALTTDSCASAAAQWSFHVPSLQAAWAAPVTAQSVAVQAANLPNGKVLTWSSDAPTSDNYGADRFTYTEILDPVAGTDGELVVSNTSHNMFCPGIANLADGRILVNGGDTNYATSIYDPVANTWTADAAMTLSRGYEGTVLNADGSVLTLGGSWSTSQQGNTTGELWHAGAGWKLLSSMASQPAWTQDAKGAFRADNHMWLHVMSGGRLLQAGPSATMHWLDPNGGSGLGSIVSAGPRGTDGDSMNGNASAFDVDKLLKSGGAANYDNASSTPTAVLIDSSGSGNPAVTPLAPMAYARGFANSVVLPNGQVVVAGGQTYDVAFTDTNAVLVPEIWDPSTQVFSAMAPMATPRTYHSTALLLPDGRVWVGGGGLCGTGCGTVGANHLTYEVLTPPYLLTASGAPASRPVIAGVNATTIARGARLVVQTQSPVKTFALMRLASVTHSVNNDQRRVPLAATTQDGQTYSAVLPTDPGVLVPGYYMLFAMNARGVPSQSITLLIQ